MNSILVTGGAGFIGGEFVRQWISEESGTVINLDKLTYAGNLDSLESVTGNPRYIFVHGDIGDSDCIRSLLAQHRPSAVINFAAESHVDRSIDGPAEFVETNVLGTFRLLEESRNYWRSLPDAEKESFRFSTYLLTKFTDRSALLESLRKQHPTPRTHRIRFQSLK